MYQGKLSAFEELVKTRFDIYNGLFLNLSYTGQDNVGHLLPLLQKESQVGLELGLDPESIINHFFEEHLEDSLPEDRMNFLFKVVQYIERQVVLYDSVEDSAFPSINNHREGLNVRDFAEKADRKDMPGAVEKKLNEFAVRIIFTAHPTQFYPRSILGIMADLRSQIKTDSIREINQKLHQLGLTSMLLRDKPTPLDEAKNIIHYMRSVYYEAIGSLYAELRNEVGEEELNNPDIVQLGFWPGGDRDGNPFVTAEITKQVADELRMNLMKCYYHDIKELSRVLSFKSIDKKLSALQSDIYKAMFDANVCLSYENIISSLEEVKQELSDDYHSLFIEDLQIVIDKVRIFRTHFARMDIRQNHSVHEKAVTELLIHSNRIQENLNELDESELIQILCDEKLSIDGFESEDSLIQDTLKNMAQLASIQVANGSMGCERYIISNSEDIFAILFVFALLRWAGSWDSDLPIDIIPLFESMDGMVNSRAIMQQVFSIPAYRKHVLKRGDNQTMMLGFSDGTKDGGYLQANWNIFKTKENLSLVCKEHGVRSMFFDGRGGPPARGGGKTHRFYAAQSDRISNNEIQVTIQGQTITSTYGTQEQFKYNCRQMLAAGLSNEIYGEEHLISDEDRSIIESMAVSSFEKYTSLKNHPQFINYLEQKSTLKYYSKANIGSRPSKRGSDKQLTLEDLRAISFVGSWSQLKQNVPGYFGIGTALKQLDDSGNLKEAKRLFADVPLFRALVLNSMMSLAKTNFALTRYMAKDVVYGSFWDLLNEEFELTYDMVLKITGYDELMQEEPVSRLSVQAREKIVLPLLVIQQFALIQIQKDVEQMDSYEKLVTRTLYGNINASRNSA